jgi:hypothetical protein
MSHIKLFNLLREIYDVDTPEASKAFAAIHKDNLIHSLDYFTEKYIEIALWSSVDSINAPDDNPDEEDDEEDIEGDEWKTEPKPVRPALKSSYTVRDMDMQTIERMQRDCKDFYHKYSEMYHSAGWADSLAAHDFWLTRNRHGAGFWDREQENLDRELYLNMSYERFEDIKDNLTKAAHSYGEFNLYMGDDGLIYGG